MSILAKSWVDKHATWYEVGLSPGHIVLDGNPANPSKKAANFRPMSIVAKWSPISATAEHLLQNILLIKTAGQNVLCHGQ